MGISGLDVDYEHIRFAGLSLWKLLLKLYQNFFTYSSVPESVLTGVILPFFKGKGAKANNKDNYRGITLGSWSKKLYRLGTHFYQVGHGSWPMVISGTRIGTYLLP